MCVYLALSLKGHEILLLIDFSDVITSFIKKSLLTFLDIFHLWSITLQAILNYKVETTGETEIKLIYL